VKTPFVFAVAASLALWAGLSVATADEGKKVSALGFKMKAIDGKEIDLSEYKGKVVLFVNVASRCGYTPQYSGLEKLYEKYKDQGLVVVGVPANEFGKQEPGTDAEIATFCKTKYDVTFPMLSKVVVKGKGITPLYQYLTTNAKPTGDVKWNFEKFLIAKDGSIAGRFLSGVAPESQELTKAIEAELKK
jgi:glutathione peroxidase